MGKETFSEEKFEEDKEDYEEEARKTRSKESRQEEELDKLIRELDRKNKEEAQQYKRKKPRR